MTVTIEEFAALDLRVGTIVEAKPVPKTTKLMEVVVDLGTERRTLVAGVAMSYPSEKLVGLQVVVVTNLAPATIHGIESQGMMLGVGCERPGEVSLVTLDRPAANGAAVM